MLDLSAPRKVKNIKILLDPSILPPVPQSIIDGLEDLMDLQQFWGSLFYLFMNSEDLYDVDSGIEFIFSNPYEYDVVKQNEFANVVGEITGFYLNLNQNLIEVLFSIKQLYLKHGYDDIYVFLFDNSITVVLPDVEGMNGCFS